MKIAALAVLLAISTLAAAADPSSKLPIPKRAWAFHGDGILDLDLVDTNKPVILPLNREPGHFVRVLFPKAFGTQYESFAIAASSNIQHFTPPVGEVASGRRCIDLAADPNSRDGRGVFAFQAPDGKAIVLIASIEGKATSPLVVLSYLDFWKAKGYAFTVDAGPAINPLER